QWLPDLVQSLMTSHVVQGKVRFFIQATLAQPEWNSRRVAALARLKQFPAEYVKLVGLEGSLAPDVYYQLVSQADLLLCPYDPPTYRRRSSGTLTEAIAAGIPTVVPRGTWLEKQQPAGAGETFIDLPSFLEAVRLIC